MQTKELYLKKLHADILTIMDEIDRVCRENNLRYYLIGGTLLGAIRHKGFIPWDDDLDIVMPREDLNKLIEIAPKVLKPQFELNWFTTRENYNHFFPKICIKNTLFHQNYYKDCAQMGIFVDIFPLDLSPEYTPALDREKKILRRLCAFRTLKYERNQTLRHKIYAICGLLLGKRVLVKIDNRLNTLKSKGRSHYANFGSGYSIKRQTMPVEWYGDGKRVAFEDREYMVPVEYDRVLTSIFSSNYMQLPPEEKRFCHYPAKVVFSDGEIMEFEQPKWKKNKKD